MVTSDDADCAGGDDQLITMMTMMMTMMMTTSMLTMTMATTDGDD